MDKNIKKMFLLTTLVFLLVGLSTITASEIKDNQTTQYFKENTINEVHKELSVNTPQPTITENKNQITKTKQNKQKQNTEAITTNLKIKFENDPEDEYSTDEYKTVHLHDEYTIDITLTEDQSQTPIPTTIKLYLQEDTQPLNITLDQTGHTQQTYTTQNIGYNTIYAEYEGNTTYAGTQSENIILNTEQYQPTITIEKIDNTCFNSTITIKGTLYNEESPMANENIIISFNNNQITTTKTNNTGQYKYELNLENIPIQEKAKISIQYISNNEEIADAYQQEEFDIEKIKNNIQINTIENTIIQNNITINGKITDENNKNYTGTIKANITNKDTNQTVYLNNTINATNGIYSFNYTPQTIGNYRLIITTNEDEYYMESIKETEFTVEKHTPTLKIEESYQTIVQENVSITGQLLNENQQPIDNIPITISTDTQTLGTINTDNEGSFNFTEHIFQETTEDEYIPLYFNITTNEKCYNSHSQSKIYITKRNVKITLNTDNQTKINGTIHLQGQVTDAYNKSIKSEGTITIYIEDEKKRENIPLDNGTYNTTINIQEDYIGKETLYVEAFFIPDNPKVYYDQNYAYSTIQHNILSTNLTINTQDTRVDQITYINITLQDENQNKLNKIITITITNPENQIELDETIQLTDGTANITFNPNKEGIYKITAQYDGEENIYEERIEDDEITVRKTETNITLNNITGKVYVNDTITITGKLIDEDNNPLTNKEIKIIINSTNTNKEETVITNPEGKYEYKFKPLQSQQYNITTIYEGNYKYDNRYINTIIIPQKHNTKVITTNIISPVKYNSTITITGRVVDEESSQPVNGTLTITLNDKIIDTITLVNGEYNIQHQIKTIQNNEIRIKFNENNAYNESIEKIRFTTIPLTTTITINPIAITEINKTVRITGKVVDENNNNVNAVLQIKINNQYIGEDINVTGGFFTYIYQTDKVGINTLNITAIPRESYHSTTTTNTTFNVIRTNLCLINLDKQVNNKENIITITGQLVNNNNIPTNNIRVNITVNDKEYDVTTGDNGLFTLTTEKLQPNKYSIRLKVNQTPYFNKYEQNLGKVTINKDTPIIYCDKIKNATYSKNINITGNITDNYNRPLTNHEVIIILENREYSTRTDNHGRYSITVNKFHAGTNTLNIIVPETNLTLESRYNTTFNANKADTKIIIQPQGQIIPGDTLNISGQLLNQDNNILANKTVKITVNDRTYHTNTDNEGKFKLELEDISSGTYNVNISFRDENHNINSTSTTIRIEKLEVILVVDDIVARVGEYITFHATLTDQHGNKANGGNLVFKLNGRTLRSDGRFDTDTQSVLKFNVKNGVVECTLIADLYLRHGKNISASYSGSYKYNGAKSNIALASIQLRYANINVTTSVKKIKHHENITFLAKLKDVTPNSNKNYLNNGTKVFFKINGVTIKDKQNNIIKADVNNNAASLNYNITAMAGIDKNNDIRDYIVTAVYENIYYYPVNNKNTTTFNVERSSVNISIQEARVKDNLLSVKANLTDYLGYNIVGKSKICIKINGVTYKENNSTKYFTIRDGKININNINTKGMKVKRLEIVTGQRLAYLSARQSTTNIIYQD